MTFPVRMGTFCRYADCKFPSALSYKKPVMKGKAALFTNRKQWTGFLGVASPLHLFLAVKCGLTAAFCSLISAHLLVLNGAYLIAVKIIWIVRDWGQLLHKDFDYAPLLLFFLFKYERSIQLNPSPFSISLPLFNSLLCPLLWTGC